jgi:hypothetical protein
VPEYTGHKLLYPFLATKLAEYLEVGTEDLPEGAELNEVTCRYLKESHGKPQEVYAALKTVWAEAASLPVSEPLLQLADIRPIKLFVSTTFDSTLGRAIDEKRFGGNPRTLVRAHSPNETEDIPGNLDGLGAPVVYQLMGKLSAIPVYAVTQEDVIEFFHSLQSDTRRPKQLFHQLASRSLLMLGTRLSGWLTSFLMRMAKNQRLSADDKTDFVADETVRSDKNLVLFLQRFSSATRIYGESDPVAFVRELHERWTEKHPNASLSDLPQTETASSREVEAGAVFFSYANEDRSVVEKLKDALDQVGVEAFFDREQLHAGNDWESKLRRNIERCSIFVPVISQRTLTSEFRFFRSEWRQALERAKMASFSPEDAFLLPVLIDDTRIDNEALPVEFRAKQVITLPGGSPTPEFVERVRLLYRKCQLAGMGNV